jgi:hypothetical protein
MGKIVPGLYFEEFAVGQRFEHRVRRTVTETDNLLFSALTMNPAACTWTEYPGHPVRGAHCQQRLHARLLVGLSVYDTTTARPSVTSAGRTCASRARC